MKLIQLTLATTFIAIATGAAEEPSDLVKKLKGNTGKVAAPATRGFSVETKKASSGSTRTLTFGAGRGIPASIKAAAEEDSLTINKSKGAGSQQTQTVSYNVDDSSQVTRNNILFKKGSTEFTDEGSYNAIAKLSTALRHSELAGFKFVIEGHASADGNADNNQKLSQLRAEKIKTVMVALGVPKGNLIPIGFGESKAAHAENAPEQQLKTDRKVIIFRLNK